MGHGTGAEQLRVWHKGGDLNVGLDVEQLIRILWPIISVFHLIMQVCDEMSMKPCKGTARQFVVKQIDGWTTSSNVKVHFASLTEAIRKCLVSCREMQQWTCGFVLFTRVKWAWPALTKDNTSNKAYSVSFPFSKSPDMMSFQTTFNLQYMAFSSWGGGGLVEMTTLKTKHSFWQHCEVAWDHGSCFSGSGFLHNQSFSRFLPGAE